MVKIISLTILVLALILLIGFVWRFIMAVQPEVKKLMAMSDILAREEVPVKEQVDRLTRQLTEKQAIMERFREQTSDDNMTD
ncbi:hypothetical protein IV73_GL000945 [Weissella kandleri]|uniref:Uncharacterized protein n=1 Tax=Weissella kandleri TaxID=1616 RepID=A0A0R2JCY8_9LACO|nr:hypothetical protein [Weissella kandleri]KRN75183.1 hypothetical protein IV73_GL000945 [Weissella kandleri]